VTGPVPADSHRSQTRNSYHDSLLLAGPALRCGSARTPPL